MARERSPLGPLAVLVGAACLGIGAALALRSEESQPSSLPIPDPNGNTGIVPPHLATAPAQPAGPAEAGVAAFWSRSPIVLDEVLDPYNPQLEALRIAAIKRQGFPSDSVAGALYNGIRKVIGAIPVAGPIVLAAYEILTSLASAAVGASQGGWGLLSKDQRQRALLYSVVGSAFASTVPFPSQIYDPDAPRTKPVRYGGVESPAFQANYRRWLRRYLIETARAAEFERISRTDEEAMLPRDVIANLIDAKLWPPPLEPMPLRLAEFRARYAGTQNPAQWFLGFEDSLIEHDNPETQLVYQTLLRQYAADAERFRNATARIGLAPEIRQLMLDKGSVPRLGSLANPGPGVSVAPFPQASDRPSEEHVAEYRVGYLRGVRAEAKPRSGFSGSEADFYYQLGLSDGVQLLPPLWN